ncbi:hypothetical protein BsWGS_13673 [Bradybaena similaris]
MSTLTTSCLIYYVNSHHQLPHLLCQLSPTVASSIMSTLTTSCLIYYVNSHQQLPRILCQLSPDWLLSPAVPLYPFSVSLPFTSCKIADLPIFSIQVVSELKARLSALSLLRTPACHGGNRSIPPPGSLKSPCTTATHITTAYSVPFEA